MSSSLEYHRGVEPRDLVDRDQRRREADEVEFRTIEEGADIWDWLKTGGGRDAVAGYLRARDVSAFAPGGAPPMTEAKAIMLAAGLSAVESALVEMMRQRRGEFAGAGTQERDGAA